MRTHIIWTIVALIFSFSAFLFGTRVGVWEHQLADSQYKASILAHQLMGLKGPKRDEILEGMEISLNGEIARHGGYLESRWKWLWPQLNTDFGPIKRALAYRKENPYEDPDLTDPDRVKPGVEIPEGYFEEMGKGQREQKRLINVVNSAYE